MAGRKPGAAGDQGENGQAFKMLRTDRSIEGFCFNRFFTMIHPMRLRSIAPLAPPLRWTVIRSANSGLPSPAVRVRTFGPRRRTLLLALLLAALASLQMALGGSAQAQNVPLPQARPEAVDDSEEGFAPPPPPPVNPQAWLPRPPKAGASGPGAAATRSSGPAGAAAGASNAPANAAPRVLARVPLPVPRPAEADGDDDGPSDAAETAQEPDAEPRIVAPLPMPPPPASGGTAGLTRVSPVTEAMVGPTELPALCAALVDQKTIEAERAPPVNVKAGCPLPVPIRLTGIRLADGSMTKLAPAAILTCDMVSSVTDWVREDIGPAVAALGTRLEVVKVAASYDCRSRNRVRGAKMSLHGSGKALDVGGFTFADGQKVEVKDGSIPMPLQTAFRETACKSFTTVLGPGSDGYHEDHIHMDIETRRLGVRLCQWTIKAPAPPMIARTDQGPAAVPQPEAKPAAANPAEAQPAEADEVAEEEEAPAVGQGGKPVARAVVNVPLPQKRPAFLR